MINPLLVTRHQTFDNLDYSLTNEVVVMSKLPLSEPSVEVVSAAESEKNVTVRTFDDVFIEGDDVVVVRNALVQLDFGALELLFVGARCGREHHLHGVLQWAGRLDVHTLVYSAKGAST